MNFITIGLVAAASTLFGFLTTADAADVAAANMTGSILVAEMDAPATIASLAWAGENETFSSIDLGDAGLASQDEIEVNVQLITGIAAPEPPAIVLAGMAIGGMLCGRSLLRKRRPAATKETC
ncbi:MAG: hypothetical protein ACR2IT_13550 [Pirellulales bacterium]